MSPPASAKGEEEILEGRCAGCGETLEVERGLTEFICPDCSTAQALPPELMPPLRDPHPAAVPHREAAVRGAAERAARARALRLPGLRRRARHRRRAAAVVPPLHCRRAARAHLSPARLPGSGGTARIS